MSIKKPSSPVHWKEQRPRILFVDNEPDVRVLYARLLEQWGYEPVIAQGYGKSLIRSALQKAAQYRCCLALVDLRLEDDENPDDLSGIRLAVKMHPAGAIIISGYGKLNILRELHEKSPEINFISKADDPETKKRILAEEVSKISASKRKLKIHNLEPILEHIKDTKLGPNLQRYPDQIADLLARLFPKATELTLERLNWGSSAYRNRSVPRPRSIILKVFEEDYDPVLVKLARPEKTRTEKSNYEKYLEGKNGSFIPNLQRSAILWDIGGIKFSYIAVADAKPFSVFYEEKSIAEIDEGFHSFFNDAWGRWYSIPTHHKDMTLVDLYNKVWDDWFDKAAIHDSLSMETNADPIYSSFDLPDPMDWLEHRILDRNDPFGRVAYTRTCVTHGDLHGDNLLVDKRGNAWPIDFERTGEGHILQDFIELEADLVMRIDNRIEDPFLLSRLWFAPARQKELGTLDEQELYTADSNVHKALQTISCLRALARECTQISDARQYVLGLLFNALFRARIASGAKDEKRQQRALTWASILCHRLEHWEEPWPPAEWEARLQGQEESNA